MIGRRVEHARRHRRRSRSAGSEPGNPINPTAIEAMREVGIDITGAVPQRLEYDTARTSDVIITIGCGNACPVFSGKRYEDWQT